MEKIINYKFVISILVLFGVMTNCRKFVEVAPPKTQLVTTSVFSDNTTANSAVTSIYAQMFNSSNAYYIPFYTGLSSDELISYSTVPDIISFFNNGLSPLNNRVQNFWSDVYNYIYQTNSIIEGLRGNNIVTPEVKQQLIGEAQFFRALSNFYLTNLFGDIPLVTSTDYHVNALASRSPKSQIYRQIIKDLKDAENLLNINFVGSDGVTLSDERVRPSKWAAKALLARVYLYTENWDSAEVEATQLISNPAFSLSSLDSVFLANSTEAIWQIQPVSQDINTQEGYQFILLGAPQTGNSNSSTLSSQLLNSFELGDRRKINWVDSIIIESNIYYFPFKYKIFESSVVSEYEMVLRLAEQYLIRAEARAQQGESNAVNDLNIIRNRAGLSNYSGPEDKASLLKAVAHERQVEFFAEWGHRWFDLIRTGAADSVLGSPGNICQTKGGQWSPNWKLYPIPQTERTNDSKLSQNNGY